MAEPLSFRIGGKCERLSQSEINDLVARYQHGDRDAAERLVASQVKFIWRVCESRRLVSYIDTEDLFAEAMPHVLVAILRYDPTRNVSLTNYLKPVIARKCGDYILRMMSISGKIERAPDPTHKEKIAVDPVIDNSDIDYRIDAEEIGSVIREVVSQMNAKAQSVFSMRVQGFTIEQIAEKLGRGNRVADLQWASNTLYQVKRTIFNELIRRDIAIEAWHPAFNSIDFSDEYQGDLFQE